MVVREPRADGDAAATAYVGSGTKLALESAIALAEYLQRTDAAGGVRSLRAERRTEVLGAVRGAQLDRVAGNARLSAPRSGAVQLLAAHAIPAHQPREPADATRRGSRAPKWFEEQATSEKPSRSRPPMFTPFRLRDLRLRIASSCRRWISIRAVDGTPTDWHFVHYAERGGAGLVMTEMTRRPRPDRPAALVLRAERSRVDADRRIRARGDRRQDRPAAGTLGAERIDESAGRTRMCRRRRATGRSSVSPVAWSPRPGAARDDPRRHGRGAERLRAGGDDGRARRVRPDRAALRAWLSPVRLHLAADQLLHRRLRRLAEIACAFARDLSCAGSVAGLMPHFGSHLR